MSLERQQIWGKVEQASGQKVSPKVYCYCFVVASMRISCKEEMSLTPGLRLTMVAAFNDYNVKGTGVFCTVQV